MYPVPAPAPGTVPAPVQHRLPCLMKFVLLRPKFPTSGIKAGLHILIYGNWFILLCECFEP